jgi:hypothetical protein
MPVERKYLKLNLSWMLLNLIAKTYTSIYLSICLSIYLSIYIYREREREEELYINR